MPASSSAEDKARIVLALLTKQLTLDELETAYPDDWPDIRILYERIERTVAELYHNAAELETLNGLVVTILLQQDVHPKKVQELLGAPQSC